MTLRIESVEWGINFFHLEDLGHFMNLMLTTSREFADNSSPHVRHGREGSHMKGDVLCQHCRNHFGFLRNPARSSPQLTLYTTRKVSRLSISISRHMQFAKAILVSYVATPTVFLDSSRPGCWKSHRRRQCRDFINTTAHYFSDIDVRVVTKKKDARACSFCRSCTCGNS